MHLSWQRQLGQISNSSTFASVNTTILYLRNFIGRLTFPIPVTSPTSISISVMAPSELLLKVTLSRSSRMKLSKSLSHWLQQQSTTPKSLVSSMQCPSINELPVALSGIDTAVAATSATVVLTFDLSLLHFTDLPNPRNFADMSKDPFPSPKAPAPLAPAAPAGGALAPPAGTVPVTNIFNYRALPSDVRLRFDHHSSNKMMTRTMMALEFSSTIPNLTLDPSGATMRTTLSYLNPPVTGDRIDYSEWFRL